MVSKEEKSSAIRLETERLQKQKGETSRNRGKRRGVNRNTARVVKKGGKDQGDYQKGEKEHIQN